MNQIPALENLPAAAVPTGSTTLGDSPLVTPRMEADGGDDDGGASTFAKQPQGSSLMEKMTQAIQNPTAVKPRAAADGEDTKKRGW